MVFDGPGRPLRRVDVVPPVPAKGEVLVRVLACTLCGSDLHTWAGRRHEPCPTVLGHEILGRVESLPAASPSPATWDGRPLTVGDRVVWAVAVGCGTCFFCLRDLPQKCTRLLKYGHTRFAGPGDLRGGLATHVLLAPKTAVFHVPDGVPDDVASPAGCATATVAAALRHAGELAGAAVLIFGAGLLGLTAAAMARSRGAQAVIVADPNPERLARAESFGATAVAGSGELEAVIQAATAGHGVDVAVELSGSPEAASDAVARLRVGGRCLWVGAVFPSRPVALIPETIVRRHLLIQGIHNYHPRDLADALTFLKDYHHSFPLRQIVGAPVSLADADAAFGRAHDAKTLRQLITP
jgi:alcohol dehydrogenase